MKKLFKSRRERAVAVLRSHREEGFVIPVILWILGVPLTLILILWLLGVF